MTAGTKDVKTYLEELEKTKGGRAEQVREGLEIYIELWERAIQRGIVSGSDPVDLALSKIDERGGLYAAAGEEDRERA